MLKMKLSPVVLLMLFVSGCGSTSPVGVKDAAVGRENTTNGKGDVADQSVSIVATVESYGYYAKSHADSATEPVSSAAILRVDDSSLPGPQRIIVFFPSDAPESLVALFRAKGAVLEFRMKMSWFRAAAFQGAVVDGATTVFVGSLEAVVSRSQSPQSK